MNFIVENAKLHESLGFSCQPCLFDLEKEAPIMSDPAAYGIRRIMRPSSEDLSLGFFYVEEDVIEIVDLLVKQKHSGATLSVVISIVVRLLKDYTNR